MYKKVTRLDYQNNIMQIVSVSKNNGQQSIPIDEDNMDYQELIRYLESHELAIEDLEEYI